MRIACVGSRKLTNLSDKLYLESIGARLAEQGHTMTSGNAPGADQTFHLGFTMVDIHCERSELYLPWSGFEVRALPVGQPCWLASQATEEHIKVAQLCHPAWNSLTQGQRLLLVRNAMIIRRFTELVDAVLAWPDMSAQGWGGTGHTIRIAEYYGIEVKVLNGAGAGAGASVTGIPF